ncbi:uncharacterized protein [Dermacentor albipictus]|uniref:uncharacterized protein n=1 Tax=Dermacentor albipictus TaxID=60249 RepID=UPI0038FC6B11
MEQQIHWLNVSLTISTPVKVMRDGATDVDRFSAPPSATLPCDNAIEEETSRIFASGHGMGIVNMRLKHPFQFLVQDQDMDVDVEDMGVDVEDMDVDVEDMGGDVKDMGGDVKDMGGDVKDMGGDVKDMGGDVESMGGDVEDMGVDV